MELCNVSKEVCARKMMMNAKFAYLGNVDQHTNYFTFKQGRYEEVTSGKLFALSKIEWKSCDEYFMIVANAYYPKGEGLDVGDTMHVKILAVSKDTFTCVATSRNFSAEIKFRRID
jgi:hypothetical protein